MSFLHFLIPFVGLLAGLAWTVAVSVVMLTGGARVPGVRRAR